MCWCDEYEFTINRADEYMVREKPDGHWYVISPHDVVALIQASINRGEVDVSVASYNDRGHSFINVRFIHEDEKE